MNSYLFISGATGWLGSAFAIDCARRGYALFLTDLRPEGVKLAEYLIKTYNVEVQYRPCDLTSAQSRSELYEALKKEGLKFWGAVNVAGIDHEGAFLDRSREQILHILRLNVEATVDNSYALLKLRDEEQPFRLVNVCSLAAFFPMPYKAIYASTKRLLLDFSMALGEEIRGIGTVTALCPAGLPTTNETMRAIFAQGTWGMLTTIDTHRVARGTMDRALKGKRVYIPGFINRLLHWLGGLAPAGLAASFVGKRWKEAQNQQTMWTPLLLEQTHYIDA